MHEFSIALSIIEMVTQRAEAADAKAISEIEIEVGELSGVVLDAMEFAMESAIKGTMAAKATVVFHFIRGRFILSEAEGNATNVPKNSIFRMFLIPVRFVVLSILKSYKAKNSRLKPSMLIEDC